VQEKKKGERGKENKKYEVEGQGAEILRRKENKEGKNKVKDGI
jgi:hypothetical protein